MSTVGFTGQISCQNPHRLQIGKSVLPQKAGGSCPSKVYIISFNSPSTMARAEVVVTHFVQAAGMALDATVLAVGALKPVLVLCC